ncbi:DNA-binding response regulator [Desulfuribacillus stibiiarsenatis]|uniref:DNA-binding response regulator n=1 Tax=Desulfuribacillus stibiiarsenatis TaxID=1390249 RepID=A0A1E5L455_9FIRM|nr:LytTR family DNA-binding domain-containing protein [Desulfuribacillus stibiiarsenatis]OEH84912.1 DNA-binding response regulator [Desulfuribacillus stibiiarsenatis]
MGLRVMIAEDEVLARDELEYLLQQEKDIVLLASACNGKQFLELYQQHKPELVFLDIEMPEMEGTEVAKHLMKEDNPPWIVFTTAYEDYAIQAFRVHAIDYLLKPYEHKRLQESINRVRKLIEQKSQLIHQASPLQEKKISNLLIEEGDKLVVIKPESILYAVKEDRFTLICTDSRTIQTKLSLQDLEDKLVGYNFVRSHRSYLVNLDYIKEVETWFNGTYNIILKGLEEVKIPVSRSSAKDVFQKLEK